MIDLLSPITYVKVYRVLYQGRKDSSVEITQVSCGLIFSANLTNLSPAPHDFFWSLYEETQEDLVWRL